MIDTHAHLDLPQFDSEREAIIQQAVENGCEKIINIGIDITSGKNSLALAKTYREIYASVGIHPHKASVWSEKIKQELKNLAADSKVVAIGETGLDFYRNLSPREIQIQVFQEQIALAKELKLPLVIHSREAFGEVLEILGKTDASQIGGVLHSFSGSLKEAREGIELGFYIAFNGSLTYKNSKMDQIVLNIPPEKILTETDSPYLPPQPFRGQRNQPAYIRLVLNKLAEILKLSFEEIETITSRNARALFNFND